MVSSAQEEMIFLREEEDKTGVNTGATGHLVILFSLWIRRQGPLLQEGQSEIYKFEEIMVEVVTSRMEK